MKWFLLALELLMLFVANNALFWLPGGYDWFNFVAAAIAVLIAAVSAWFSGRIFARHRLGERITQQEIVTAPPAIVWVSVVAAFCFAGLMKILAHR